MTLDCDTYRINESIIKDLLADRTPLERLQFLGTLAIVTYVPIIVVACYAASAYPDTPGIEAYILRLQDFYNVTEILNRTP